MTEINNPPTKYYVLNPDDNVDEFVHLFTELYPHHTISIRRAIFEATAPHQPSITWTIIVVES